MRRLIIALALAAAPLGACATHTPHVATNNPRLERQTLTEVETAYREAAAAYATADSKGAWSPEQRQKAFNALTAAHSAMEATRSAFEAENAPTFMDQAVTAKRMAGEAKAIIPA